MQAETLKYFYLLFSPNDFFPLSSVVFNTEAHIFPRFKLARGLQTDWERKQRDDKGHVIESAKKAKTLRPEPVRVQESAPTTLATEKSVSEGHIGL